MVPPDRSVFRLETEMTVAAARTTRAAADVRIVRLVTIFRLFI